MSKECKQARNIVASATVILVILIVIMSMSSCGTTSYNSNPAYAGWNGGCQAAGNKKYEENSNNNINSSFI